MKLKQKVRVTSKWSTHISRWEKLMYGRCNRSKPSFINNSQRRAVTVTSWSATPMKGKRNQSTKYLALTVTSWCSSKQRSSKRLFSPKEQMYTLCCSRFWPENTNTLSFSFQQLNLSFEGDCILLRYVIFAKINHQNK